VYGSGEKAPKTGTPLPDLMVVQDVQTRWNYTYAMIKLALLLRKVMFVIHSTLQSIDYSKAIDRWVADREELHPLCLSAEQWDYLEKLYQMLEVRMTIPAIDHVTYHDSMPGFHQGYATDVPCKYADPSLGSSHVRAHDEAPEDLFHRSSVTCQHPKCSERRIAEIRDVLQQGPPLSLQYHCYK
jgi:hypothetical protein